VHVEGVLLDAGDALGEPALLVVAAAVGQHPGGRRVGGLWGRIWPAALVLVGGDGSGGRGRGGAGDLVARGSAPSGLARCGRLCSSRVFLC
jgi:hypothetical protein